MSRTLRTFRPRRALRIAAALAAGALALSGCGPTSPTGAPLCLPFTHHDGPLVVEGDPWSGYAAFRAADLLPGRITYREQLDQADRACDLTDGDADFIVTTIGQYVRHRPDGAIVGVIDQSQGADAMVLNTRKHPYLRSSDWFPKLVAEYGARKAKPVLAYTGGSPSEELLYELANTIETIRPAQFDLVPVDQSATALRMLDSGKAQVAIVWEPDTTEARSRGYTVAHSSKDVPDSIVDVLVASRSVLDDDPAAVTEVVDAYYDYMDRKLADPAALQAFIAADGNIDAGQAESVLRGIKLYGAGEADAFMNTDVFPLDEPQLHQSLKAIGSLQALTDGSLQLRDDMVDGRFISAATRRSTPR